MLVGDVGRLAALGPRRRARDGVAGALPSAQVHARLAGRGRRRDHQPPRARGLGRGQVRRHPGPAPQAGHGGPALLARPARHQRRLPGDRRRRPRALAWDGILDGEILAWRDGDGPAVHRAPDAGSDARRRRRRSRPRSRSSTSPSMSSRSDRATARRSSRSCARRSTERRVTARRARPPARRRRRAVRPIAPRRRRPTPTRSRPRSPMPAPAATRA